MARAQTGNSVGIGTAAPDARAVLDVQAPNNDQGLLIPRLDSAQRAAIGSPPDGLMVFQRDGRTGLWYAFGGQWLYIPDKVRSGDNLGSHRASQNLRLSGNWLGNDGGNEGLRVDDNGNVGIGSSSPGARLEVNGFTKLGDNAPALKTKKITLTTSSTPGQFATVAHGLNGTKIISVSGTVEYMPNAFVSLNTSAIAQYSVAVSFDATNVAVYTHPGNSAQVLSKSVRLLIVYEE